MSLGVLLAVVWVAGYAPRKVALPMAWALLPAAGFWVLSGRWRWPLALFAAFLAVSFGPIDVWIKTGGTRPRVIKVVDLPVTEAQNKLIEEGELLCFGPECAPSTRKRSRPKWVLMWLPSPEKVPG